MTAHLMDMADGLSFAAGAVTALLGAFALTLVIDIIADQWKARRR